MREATEIRDERRQVETVEEFKFRIAAMIRGKVQEIPSPGADEPAAGPAEEAGSCTFTKYSQEKTNAALT